MADTTDKTQNERCPYAVWNRDWQEFNCRYNLNCRGKVRAGDKVFICARIVIRSYEEFLSIENACRRADIELIARRAEVAARIGF